MTNSHLAQASIFPFMPELPEGFYWEIEKVPFGIGNSPFTKTTVYLKSNDFNLEDNVVKHADVIFDRKMVQNPSELDLREVGADLMELTEAKLAFRK